jgi:NAD(P)-dependent dehydrogenase (short-subunit alcohol dehydrogenase family)
MKTLRTVKKAYPLFDLTGKVVVVTGGAGLIGGELARGLSDHGASVFIAEVDSKRADQTCAALSNQDRDLRAVGLDVTNIDSISACIDNVLRQSNGNVDTWINCAYPKTKDWGSALEAIPAESWRKNVDGQLNGYCFCCQKVAEQMKKQGKGSIINFASTYGMVGPDFSIYEGTEMTMPAAYAAIKGGIINFTRYLAAYYGAHGVRANSISPGGVFDHQPNTFVKKYSEKTPLKRMANESDFTGAAVYLASDASSYVTGHNLVVDGGWTAI